MIPNRVAIFIDGSNFYHILKKTYNDSRGLTTFNFEKFTKVLVNGRKHTRTYYYTAALDQKKNEETYKKQQRFFDKLRKIPAFELILCRMQKELINGKLVYTVKEDDIQLAVDMLELAYKNAFDTAILVSSDADFVPAIIKVKAFGKVVENIGFENKFSWFLKQKCNKFRQLKNNELGLCFD